MERVGKRVKPKLIKGPDIFLKVVELINKKHKLKFYLQVLQEDI